MKKKVLVLGEIDKAGLNLLTQNSTIKLIHLLGKDATDEQKIEQNLRDSDALLVRSQPLKSEWITKANNLKIISRYGVGIDNLPLEQINQKKIPLLVIEDVNSISVAEHIIMLLLACAKQLLKYKQAIKWQLRDNGISLELQKKNLLLVGYGKVGKQVLKRLIPFEMNFNVYDPYVPAEQLKSLNATKVLTLNNGLLAADFILLCCPLTAETKKIISAKRIKLMKQDAILINCARGDLVDETELFLALQQNRLGAAGLDVFENEPLDLNNPLIKLDNCILTPHSASKTKECLAKTSLSAVSNILDFFVKKTNLSLVVNSKSIGLN